MIDLDEEYSTCSEEEEAEEYELEEGELQIEEEESQIPPPLPPKTHSARSKKRTQAPRWDQVEPTIAPRTGKDPPSARSYKSWRAHKNSILNCLQASGGSVAFTRRYMLFKHGHNVPKNVIHYYNSRYRSQEKEEQGS